MLLWMLWAAATSVVFGTIYRLWRIARTPQPNNIALTPAPQTVAGTCWRVISAMLFFPVLWQRDKLLWLLAWGFHYGLLLLFIAHLAWFVGKPFQGVALWCLHFAAGVATLSISGLLLRRICLPAMRWISAPSDYLWPALFLFLCLSGCWMAWSGNAHWANAYAFLRGGGLPVDWVLWGHVIVACLIGLCFPASKLFHGWSLPLTPTLTQRPERFE